VIYAAAGSDTTDATVEAAILYMVLYPAAAKKAQAELDSVIGKDRLPMLGDRSDLPYVTAFLKVQCSCAFYYPNNLIRLQEVMRCSPSLPCGGDSKVASDRRVDYLVQCFRYSASSQ
jgi:cytochrome P450